MDAGTADAPLTYHMDLSQVRQTLEKSARYPRNVTGLERVLSGVAGAALAAFGLSRRSIPGVGVAALGTCLLERGLTGHCAMYKKMGINKNG